MAAIVGVLNTIFWGYVLIYVPLAVGVYFTLRLGFIQFRHFGEMVRAIRGSRQPDKSGISLFGMATACAKNALAVLAMVVWGSLQTVATTFDAADAWRGLMAMINLVAIVLLSGMVAKLTRDYVDQQRVGRVPHFHGAAYPELARRIDTTIWAER